MYVRGYLQGSENGRVVTIADSIPSSNEEAKRTHPEFADCSHYKCTHVFIKWWLVSTSFKIYLEILSHFYIKFTVFYYNTISLKRTFLCCLHKLKQFNNVKYIFFCENHDLFMHENLSNTLIFANTTFTKTVSQIY
jgi:ABC-type maltose transport system permease subunit